MPQATYNPVPKIDPRTSGRLDLIASHLMDKVVENKVKDPVVQMFYMRHKDAIDKALKHFVGPRTTVGRRAKKVAKAVGETLVDLRKQQAEAGGAR